MARPMAIFPQSLLSLYGDGRGDERSISLGEVASTGPSSLLELRTNMVMLSDLVNVALFNAVS